MWKSSGHKSVIGVPEEQLRDCPANRGLAGQLNKISGQLTCRTDQAAFVSCLIKTSESPLTITALTSFASSVSVALCLATIVAAI